MKAITCAKYGPPEVLQITQCKKALAPKGTSVSIDDSALLLNSDRLNRIKELVELGKIVPINDKCYSFEQIIEAHKYVETGHKKGNVAITVNQKS